MHIFFKLVAIGGIGGAIGGTTYFARQEYTNVHLSSSNVPTRKALDSKKTINIRRQPSFGPRTEEESDDSESDTSIPDVTKPEAGGGSNVTPAPKLTTPKAPAKPGPASKSPLRPKPAKPSPQKPQVGRRVVRVKKPAPKKP